MGLLSSILAAPKCAKQGHPMGAWKRKGDSMERSCFCGARRETKRVATRRRPSKASSSRRKR